jgi:hypothetical protein
MSTTTTSGAGGGALTHAGEAAGATAQTTSDPDVGTCGRCHGEATIEIDGGWLCVSCYSDIGSCCLEFDGDDLNLAVCARMEPPTPA